MNKIINESLYTSFVMLDSEWITNKEITNEMLTVYLCIRGFMYDNVTQQSKLFVPMLYDILGVDSKQNKLTTPVIKAINDLVYHGMIVVNDALNFEEKIFDIKECLYYSVEFPREYELKENLILYNSNKVDNVIPFTKIPYVNLESIFNYILDNKGIKKYTFLRYYLLIAKACSNPMQVFSLSYATINDVINISNKTCNDYNDTLKSLDCILYTNNMYYIKNNKIKNSATFYGHIGNPIKDKLIDGGNYEDKMVDEKFFKMVVDEIIKEKGYVIYDKEAMATKRSNTMKQKWANGEMNRKNNKIEKENE